MKSGQNTNLYKLYQFKEQNYNMTLDEFKVIFGGNGFTVNWVIDWHNCFNTDDLFYFQKWILVLRKYGIFSYMFTGFIGWYMVSSGLIDRVDVSHYRLSTLVTALLYCL